MGTDEQPTEARHPGTVDIDELSTLEFVRLMNAEDARVAVAVAAEIERVAEAIDRIAAKMREGGRLVYVGAGTSGRLGVLDAAECPATFSTTPGQVIALIAGGHAAITNAVENAEDVLENGRRDIDSLAVRDPDSVVAISASGKTPYVLGAAERARERGALVVTISGTQPCLLGEHAHVAIAPLVGPEVIAGSTRLKAGTAQKMILNMISTGVMVQLGKTFGNLMVDVSPTNAKLRDRARRIVETATGVGADEARALLEESSGDVKVALVMQLASVHAPEARRRLKASGGVVRHALNHRSEASAAGSSSPT